MQDPIIREVGPSPRVRGNPRRRCACGARYGSIPACAGKPRACCTARTARRVHPRVCGETTQHVHPPSQSAGPSPRVRGNPAHHCRGSPRRGSIPACAGKPARPAATRSCPGVHPRVCGETSSRVRVAAAFWGPSPRVRGNPVQRQLLLPLGVSHFCRFRSSWIKINNDDACGPCGRRLRRPKRGGKRAASTVTHCRSARARFPCRWRGPQAARLPDGPECSRGRPAVGSGQQRTGSTPAGSRRRRRFPPGAVRSAAWHVGNGNQQGNWPAAPTADCNPGDGGFGPLAPSRILAGRRVR